MFVKRLLYEDKIHLGAASQHYTNNVTWITIHGKVVNFDDIPKFDCHSQGTVLSAILPIVLHSWRTRSNSNLFTIIQIDQIHFIILVVNNWILPPVKNSSVVYYRLWSDVDNLTHIYIHPLNCNVMNG